MKYIISPKNVINAALAGCVVIALGCAIGCSSPGSATEITTTREYEPSPATVVTTEPAALVTVPPATSTTSTTTSSIMVLSRSAPPRSTIRPIPRSW